jgi:hypothetical protein
MLKKLALAALLAASATHAQPDLAAVSTDSLKLFTEFSIDPATCGYTLVIGFQHDATLPFPGGPDDCDPANVTFALDGAPYLADRLHYHLLSDEIQAATVFDHLSVDWQACGHPPAEVFTKPHYDFHLYTSSLATRLERSCELLPGAPICEFRGQVPQLTPAGMAFFAPIPTDAVGHTMAIDAAVPYSGIHSWNMDTQPANSSAWTEPVFVTGGYGDALVFWEPMVPVDFVTGTTDHAYEESITFINKTDASLPEHYTFTYNATSQYSILTITEGIAAGCVVPTSAPTSAPSGAMTAKLMTVTFAAAALSLVWQNLHT